MVCKRRVAERSRKFSIACGWGLAAWLLASSMGAWPQQPNSEPAVQPAPTSTTKDSAEPVKDSKQPIDDYTVCPEDLLDIQVMDVPELSRVYRVSSNGFLTLPLLPEPVMAAGETLNQLSQRIAAKFHEAGMLNNAQVSVSLKETRRHTVVVSGQVKSPQACPIYGPTRLIDVIVQAGGLLDDASGTAIIKRGEAGARADTEQAAENGTVNPSEDGRLFNIDIRKTVETGEDKNNILLYPGDRVMVQKAELIYILGAVSRPGGYVLNESRQQMTVLKALAMAGDVNALAKKSRITILRRNPRSASDQREEMPVNYKAMVKGKIADVRLKPDDILFVPESAAIKAWHTSVSTAVSVAAYTAPGLVIYH